MSKYQYFYLKGSRKNFTGDLQGYKFVNGVHTCSADNAEKVARILCKFYEAVQTSKSPQELAKARVRKKSQPRKSSTT